MAEAAALILARDLLDNDAVLSLCRDIKLFGRLLDSFLFVGSLNRPETFGTMPEDIDTPAGHYRHSLPVKLGNRLRPEYLRRTGKPRLPAL
jgi:hypothetical protein